MGDEQVNCPTEVTTKENYNLNPATMWSGLLLKQKNLHCIRQRSSMSAARIWLGMLFQADLLYGI